MFRVLILVAIVGLVLQAENIKVASVAGYKKPMMQIAKEYKKSAKAVDIMFGNMRKTISQAKYSDVCVVIGDKNYISTKSSLHVAKYFKIGEGQLVLAYAKGVNIKSIDDLKSEDIKRIAMPHSKKAIYGKAAKEFMKHLEYKDELQKKIYEVATVPQVATYIISKEVDAGFMNLTAAINHKDKIGGYIPIDKELYSKIDIVAATLNRDNCGASRSFIEFLNSSYSKAVFKSSGL